MDKNLEHSIQTQQKFEFYFLALVFTVLGLSIQTSQFSSKLHFLERKFVALGVDFYCVAIGEFTG